MEKPPSLAAKVYEIMDTLTMRYVSNLRLPTEVRVFAAEMAIEAISIPDDELLDKAREIDEQYPLPPGGVTLEQTYENWLTNPSRAPQNDPDRIIAYGLLRQGVASRLFRLQYRERFPDQCHNEAYQKSHQFLQGDVLTSAATKECVATLLQK